MTDERRRSLTLACTVTALLALSAGAKDAAPAKTFNPALGWTEGLTPEDLSAALAGGDREEAERILRLRSSHVSGTTLQLIERALAAEEAGDTAIADRHWREAGLLAEAWESVSGDDAHLRHLEKYRSASEEGRRAYLDAVRRSKELAQHHERGERAEYLVALDEVLAAWRSLDDRRNEAEELLQHCYRMEMGAEGWEASLAQARDAARLNAEGGFERAQAVCLKTVARGLSWQGRHDEALETLRFARGLVEALHDDWMAMRLLIDEGRVHLDARRSPYDRPRLAEGDRALTRAVETAARLEDRFWESRALDHLVEARTLCGRRASADRLLLRAIELRELLGEPSLDLEAGHRAAGLQAAGEHVRALRHLQRLREDLNPAESPGPLLYLWRQTASSHEALGQWDEAAAALEEALALAEQLGDEWNKPSLLARRAVAARELGDEAGAARFFHDAAAILDGWSPGWRLVRERVFLAWALEKCGRAAEQRAQLSQALAVAREAELAEREVELRSRLGAAWLEADDLARAEEQALAVRELLPLVDAAGWNDPGYFRTPALEFLARWHAAQGRHAEAWTWYRQLLDERAEAHPLELMPASDHTWIREEHEKALATLHALVASGQAGEELLDESLRLAQAGQAVRLRTLVAAHQDVGIDGSEEPLSRLDAQERRVLEELAAARLELHVTADAEARALVEARLVALEDEHDRLRRRREHELRVRHRDGLAQLTPLALSEVRERLPKRGAAVQWFVGKRHVFAWVVRADAAALLELAPAPEIAEVASFFLEAVSSPRRVEAARGASAELFALLVEPLLPALGDASRVLVVPDGLLHRLPIEALAPEGEEPLAATRAIAYLPALALLGREHRVAARPAGGPRSVLVVGDWQEPEDAGSLPGAWREERDAYERGGAHLAPLGHAQREARRVASLFERDDVDLLAGAQATEAAVKAADLPRRDVLHFATHAIADERSPLRSALVLAPTADEDGFLQVRELAGLDLEAELVVLSGCSTGGGRLVTGEGIEGLARGFLVAGARSLVVSLWDVDDRSTALLMQDFYQALRAGADPATALRKAKLELRQRFNGRYADPYYWAPFILIGEAGG